MAGLVSPKLHLSPYGKQEVSLTDSTGRRATVDSFERLRVSEPYSLFDSKQVYDSNPLSFVSDTTGSGSVDHVANRSASELTTSTASGDEAIFQTRRYFNYQPGKSMLILATYNFEAEETNVRKRVGYYDANDGIFLELAGTALSLVRRTSTSGSPVDNSVAQASWNIDPMDGTGPSKLTLDNTKVQILAISFQWLGVGAVTVAFDIDGRLVPIHQFNHANSLGDVYMKTPNLPVRYEITNTGTASGTPKMTAICSSVMVEGGIEQTGIPRSADRAGTGTSITNSLEPVISIRLKSAYNRATVIPVSASLMSPSAGSDIYWQLAVNPTITGGTAASFSAISNSYVEYDVAQDGATSGGTVIASGYMSADSASVEIPLASVLFLASNFDGTPDTLTLSAQKLTAGSVTVYGSISWLEAT